VCRGRRHGRGHAGVRALAGGDKRFNDDYGMATTVEDKGDDAVSGDETCTRTPAAPL
jgi:hypothetical protein